MDVPKKTNNNNKKKDRVDFIFLIRHTDPSIIETLFNAWFRMLSLIS